MIIPVLLGVTLLIFMIAKVTPGDPAQRMLGVQATPERIEELQEQLGLNKPVLVQYGELLWNILHGNLGVSYRGQKPVLQSITTRIGSTAELAAVGFLFRKKSPPVRPS